jgi:hypothetical protein
MLRVLPNEKDDVQHGLKQLNCLREVVLAIELVEPLLESS